MTVFSYDPYFDSKDQKAEQVSTEDCPVYLESQGKKYSPYITPDQYPCNKCPFKDCKVGIKRLDRPDRGKIAELAKQEVHPYAEEPVTPYEKNAVRRFISFGLQLLALIPDVEEAKREEREKILMLLPQIPQRCDHNKTCFDCVESIKRQALRELPK